MRFLIATPLSTSEAGGPAQYARRLKDALERKGCEADTLAFTPVRKYPRGIRHAAMFFLALFRMRQVDAVIVLDTFSVALPVCFAGTLFRKRIFIRVGGDFVWEQYVERTKEKTPLPRFYSGEAKMSLKERALVWVQRAVLFALAEVVIFSTEWQRSIWRIPYALHKRRTLVIENAYTVNLGSPSKDAAYDVVWIGRPTVLKNVEALTEAVDRLRREGKPLAYETFSDIPHEQVVDTLRRSRILAIPSLSDVSPNLAIEALSLGVPVMLTQYCGLKPVLGDAVKWIDPLDADGITEVLRNLLTPKGYAEAKENVNTFRSARTYDFVADDFLKLLSV